MVLAFAFALSLLTGVIFGAAPAWIATRTDPVEALRGSGRGNVDRSTFARKALLVVQATLSVVLVAGATMLGRSLNKLEHQDFGFEIKDRVVVSMNNPPSNYTLPQLQAMYRLLEDRLQGDSRRAGRGRRALQPAHRQLGRADHGGRPSAGEDERRVRRVVGSRQRELSAESRRGAEGAASSALPTTRRRRRWRSSTKRS